MLPLSKGTEDVSTQNNAIVHRDCDVPLDLYVVANLRFFSHLCVLRSNAARNPGKWRLVMPPSSQQNDVYPRFLP